MSQTPNTRKRDTSEETSQTQTTNKLPFRCGGLGATPGNESFVRLSS